MAIEESQKFLGNCTAVTAFLSLFLQLVTGMAVYMIFKHTEGSRLAYRMGFSWSLFLQGVEQKIYPKQPAKR